MTSRYSRGVGGHSIYTDEHPLLGEIADRPVFMDGSEALAMLKHPAGRR